MTRSSIFKIRLPDLSALVQTKAVLSLHVKTAGTGVSWNRLCCNICHSLQKLLPWKKYTGPVLFEVLLLQVFPSVLKTTPLTNTNFLTKSMQTWLFFLTVSFYLNLTCIQTSFYILCDLPNTTTDSECLFLLGTLLHHHLGNQILLIKKIYDLSTESSLQSPSFIICSLSGCVIISGSIQL